MQIYWIWYALLPGLSIRQKLSLLEHFSDPEEIYYTESFDNIEGLTDQGVQALKDKDLSQARKVVKQCTDRKIGILPLLDPAYPRLLRNIYDPPLVLYYRGILPDFEERPAVAVVGTRKATAYGRNTALGISRQIAACGGLVVSGGAYGVDTMALQGALDVGAQAVAVLGCGVDVAYPRANARLFEKITKTGCLFSEYLPGTGPKPWQFPERNRILSGMSHGVLVVEAPEKSGALITARNAMEQGRDVFAVPGNINVATSEGSNALLMEGGNAAVSGWDVLKEYAPRYSETVKLREPELVLALDSALSAPVRKVAQPVLLPVQQNSADKKAVDKAHTSAYSVVENKGQLSQEEQQVLKCLSSQPQPVDGVIALTGLPAASVNRILTTLTLKGMVQDHPGRQVSAIK